jgi:hypothetical protein
MFDKHKLSHDGAQAEAVVLEKKVYATTTGGGAATACRYLLRVKFEDGSTTEISRRVFDSKLASAAEVGHVVAVRYDPADRSKIELDRHAIVEAKKADADKWKAEAIARGERALGVAPEATPSIPMSNLTAPDTGDLRIGDADRESIAEVLGQHMTDGRLSTDELEDRLDVLYTSQTRAQARSALVGLPPLAPSGGQQHEPVRVLPEWVNAPELVASQAPPSVAASRPTGGGARPAPTDGEMNTAYRRWQAKAEKMKADKAAHEQAEASGDSREAALAVRLKMSRGEEKSARAKYDQLRKRRPDWKAGER